MPLYDYHCNHCHTTFESFARAEERELGCEKCGKLSFRLPSKPAVRGMMQPYQSPIDGRWIEGEAMRRDDLARSGSIPYDPEMKKDSARAAEERQKQELQMWETAVDKTAGELGIST